MLRAVRRNSNASSALSSMARRALTIRTGNLAPFDLQDRSFVEFLLFGAGASAIRRNLSHKECLSRSASVLSCMSVATPAHRSL